MQSNSAATGDYQNKGYNLFLQRDVLNSTLCSNRLSRMYDGVLNVTAIMHTYYLQ